MVDTKRLLADLKKLRRTLEADLRDQHRASPQRDMVQTEWHAALDAKRAADNHRRMMKVTGEILFAFRRDRLSHWVSRLVIAVLFVFAGAAALAPRLIPSDEDTARRVAAASIFAVSYLALAIRRVPGLSIDRAGIALLVASGAIALPAAYRIININTITLLLGVMIVVTNLRLSSLFAPATRLMATRVHRPIALLGAGTVVAGIALTLDEALVARRRRLGHRELARLTGRVLEAPGARWSRWGRTARQGAQRAPAIRSLGKCYFYTRGADGQA